MGQSWRVGGLLGPSPSGPSSPNPLIDAPTPSVWYSQASGHVLTAHVSSHSLELVFQALQELQVPLVRIRPHAFDSAHPPGLRGRLPPGTDLGRGGHVRPALSSRSHVRSARAEVWTQCARAHVRPDDRAPSRVHARVVALQVPRVSVLAQWCRQRRTLSPELAPSRPRAPAPGRRHHIH